MSYIKQPKYSGYCIIYPNLHNMKVNHKEVEVGKRCGLLLAARITAESPPPLRSLGERDYFQRDCPWTRRRPGVSFLLFWRRGVLRRSFRLRARAFVFTISMGEKNNELGVNASITQKACAFFDLCDRRVFVHACLVYKVPSIFTVIFDSDPACATFVREYTKKIISLFNLFASGYMWAEFCLSVHEFTSFVLDIGCCESTRRFEIVLEFLYVHW